MFIPSMDVPGQPFSRQGPAVKLLTLLCVLALGIVFLPPVLNMVSFIRENRGTGHFELLKTRSRLPLPLLVLRGTLSAFFGNVYWLSGVHHFLHFGLSRPQHTDPNQPVILMVHGLYHNSSAWRVLKKHLQAKGFVNGYTWSYPSFSKSFQDLVHDCTRAIQRVQAVHPNAGLVLIGHSLGGLILRQAMCDPELPPRVGMLITLGTPHQGTRTARMGPGRLARGLVPDGKIIQEVRDSKCCRSLPALSLYSNLDTMVVPASGLRIHEPGWREQETEPTTHVAMLFNAAVCRTVVDCVSSMPSGQDEVEHNPGNPGQADALHGELSGGKGHPADAQDHDQGHDDHVP